MTEELLNFLWKNKLYTTDSLILADGLNIEVIHPGEYNRDEGPDFFNTRIKIDETIWAGNAEVHVKASDWIKHGHSGNGSYNNVILHIVAENDIAIERADGNAIPAIVLKCNETILAQYQYLLQNRLWVPCAKQLPSVNSFTKSLWLEKLGIERLEEKSKDIVQHLNQTQNDWEETFYRILARSFGFHLNGQAFEQLAQSLPHKVLVKHADSLIQTEALIFGQAGFLNGIIPYDDYFNKLQKEYNFLAKKYKLKSLSVHLWKFLRLRPGNFPTIRLAEFSSLIHKHPNLFSTIRDSVSLSNLFELFNIKTSEYWNNHYMFGKVSKAKEKVLGHDSAEILFINAIIPALFMYGKSYGLAHIQDKALDLLNQLPAEKNSIIENWNKLGIVTHNAFHSQALLQLKYGYCDKHKCLDCAIGNKILMELV